MYGGSEAILIRPEHEWDLRVWDERAEDLHGISQAEIAASGSAARDVAERLHRVLEFPALFVLSDAPQADSAWLDVLFEATPRSRGFELHDERRARLAFFDQAAVDWPEVERQVAQQRGQMHRAEPDALALALRWRVAMNIATKR